MKKVLCLLIYIALFFISCMGEKKSNDFEIALLIDLGTIYIIFVNDRDDMKL